MTDQGEVLDTTGVSRERGLVLAIIVASGLFFLFTIRSGHAWGDDFAQYISHARNIVTGQGYADTGYLYNPAVPFGGPRTYPPLYPLLLAPIVKLFGAGNLHAMKIEDILFFGGALYLFYAFVRPRVTFEVAAASVAVLAFSPFFWDFKDNILSDIPFLLFVMLALIAIDTAYEAEPDRKADIRSGIMVGAVMYLAFGIRTLGVVLVPALIGYELVKRRRPTILAGTAISVFAVAAIAQSLLFPGGGSYGDDIKLQSVNLFIANAKRYVRAMERIAFNGVSMSLSHLFFGALIILAIAGFVSRLKRDRMSPAEPFVVAYAAAVLAWPIYQDTRLLIPLLPFFVLYAWDGVGIWARWLKRPALVKPALILLGLTFVASALTLYPKLDFGPIKEGIEKPASVEVFTFIKERTKPTDIFIFRRPKALALYAGRPASGYAQLPDAEQLKYFADVRASYLLFSSLDPPYLRLFVTKQASRLQQVFKNQDFVLYKIR